LEVKLRRPMLYPPELHTRISDSTTAVARISV
jgi:hypothetical protein